MLLKVLFAVVAAASAQLVHHPNGAVTPKDEPAVAHAKAAHLSTKAHAYAAHGYAAYPGYYAAGYAHPYAYAHGAYGYAGYAAHPYAYAAGYAAHPYAYAGYAGYPYGGLVAYPNGAVTPVDEPAVQAAKAEHFAAKGVAPVAAVHAAAPAVYAAGYAHPGLVAHPNGALVPAEPADVVAARAAHLSHF